MKYTAIGPKSWDKIKLNAGIFVDIFEWNYLPNNKFLRKIVSNLLFYIRWLEMYKMLNAYTLDPKYRTFWVIMKKIVPYKLLFKLENILKKSCGKRKTDWIIDNAVINGNHGGYNSKGIDEYEDVTFEGIKVMNKKNSHNFMRTIYGENYNQWLPPIKRISHHKWYKMDFGVYEDKFDLPENYKDYLTIKYNAEKLKHMQEVSFEIVDKVAEICKKKKLNYFLLGNDCYIKGNEIDEFGQFWQEPLKIAMPRKDYDEFAKISQKYLGEKYFYQSTETDSEYKYSYARIRLNCTYIRENKIPKYIEDKFNSGFFIKIIPLDKTSDNSKERKRHAKKIRYLNHFISIKWAKNNLRAFLKGNYKLKLKLMYLIPFSLDFLRKKLEKELSKYSNLDTNHYVDSTGYQLNGITIEKSILGKGKLMNYNRHKFIFPSDIKAYTELMDKKKITVFNKITNQLKYIKHEFPDSYLRMIDKEFLKLIPKIQKKYFACYLNYFDLPEYQLTVLRYDEKNDKILSNEELLGYK